MIKQITIHSSSSHFRTFYFHVDVCIGKSVNASIYWPVLNSISNTVTLSVFDSILTTIERQLTK